MTMQYKSVRLSRAAVTLAGALALAACGSIKPNPTPPDFQGLGSGSAGDPSVRSQLGGEGSGVIFGMGKNRHDESSGGMGGGGLGINAFLWRGALDTLGFMPLASADPFGGVIITDWYTPPETSGERFKMTAYILGRDLRSDSVRVSVFRQVLQGGQWVDATVSQVTVSEIEDKVLNRARKLREQALANS
jgi:hypothetical protein